MPRRLAVDLVAQLADEHVDGAVAMALASAPELLEQLVPADDPASLEREGVEQPELGRRQVRALAVEVGLDVERVDAELLDLDRLASLLGSARARLAATRRRTRATSSFIENGLTR